MLLAPLFVVAVAALRAFSSAEFSTRTLARAGTDSSTKGPRLTIQACLSLSHCSDRNSQRGYFGVKSSIQKTSKRAMPFGRGFEKVRPAHPRRQYTQASFAIVCHYKRPFSSARGQSQARADRRGYKAYNNGAGVYKPYA